MRNQSTTPYNGVYIKSSDLREDYAPVLDINEGEVTEVHNLGTSAAIIKKIDMRGSEIKFAVMSSVYEALPATVDDAFEAADEFLYFATEESSFDEEAERSELLVGAAFATEGNTFVSGVGSSQQVLTFLETGEEGDISEPIELATQFVVLEITEVTEAGYRSLDGFVQIETQVRNQMRRELIFKILMRC